MVAKKKPEIDITQTVFEDEEGYNVTVSRAGFGNDISIDRAGGKVTLFYDDFLKVVEAAKMLTLHRED